MNELLEKKWIEIGVSNEIKFWDQYLKSNGGTYKPEGHLHKLDPKSWLQNEVKIYLKKGIRNRILDVGAGPVSHLGKKSSIAEFDLYFLEEGSTTDWEGFHSWDFMIQNNEFCMVALNGELVNINGMLKDTLSMILLEPYQDMKPAIRVVFQKKG